MKLIKKFFFKFSEKFPVSTKKLSTNQYSRTKFFQHRKLLFKNSDFKKRCKNEIEDNNENEFDGPWSSKRPLASLRVQVNKLFLVTRNSSPPMSELVKYLNTIFSGFPEFFLHL